MVVYKATNNLNGHVYIGKTIRPIRSRIMQHIRDSKKEHYRYPFANALRKYGELNFSWEILCLADNVGILNSLERFYIAAYRKILNVFLYNVTDGGDGAGVGKYNHFYGKHHSEETKRKLSDIRVGKKMSENQKRNIALSNIGRKHTEESRKKMSESRKNLGLKTWLGKKHTEQTKEKMRKWHKENKELFSSFNKGRVMSEETKKKLSSAKKGIPKSKEARKNMSIAKKKMFAERRSISKEEQI